MIYTPIIETKIPAQYGTTITIPFQMNPAVSDEDFNGMTLVIMDAFGKEELIKTTTTKTNMSLSGIQCQAAFKDVNQNKLVPGNFYKIKIAYGEGENLTYSNYATMKYTEEPTIAFGFWKNTDMILHYTNGDKTEKPVYYTVIDSKHPEEIISGVFNNTNRITIPLKWYPINSNFTVVVTTLNDLTITKTIQSGITAYPNLGTIELNNEEGYFKIAVESGSSIVRNDEIIYINSTNSAQIFQDTSAPIGEIINYNGVEQMKTWNWGQEPDIIPYKLNSEYMYISDGEKQLAIRFNPKVSSFRTVIEETKTNTIGSKYPFISRNSTIGYKELPISGLVSYLQDFGEMFMKRSDLNIGETELSTDLTMENIAIERKFKNKVMDWLNDGKPKVLRTPTEGSYIVRFMNVSLTPNDSLGRMLHTFSATAYEVMEYTGLNLRKYNLNGKVVINND